MNEPEIHSITVDLEGDQRRVRALRPLQIGGFEVIEMYLTPALAGRLERRLHEVRLVAALRDKQVDDDAEELLREHHEDSTR